MIQASLVAGNLTTTTKTTEQEPDFRMKLSGSTISTSDIVSPKGVLKSNSDSSIYSTQIIVSIQSTFTRNCLAVEPSAFPLDSIFKVAPNVQQPVVAATQSPLIRKSDEHKRLSSNRRSAIKTGQGRARDSCMRI